MSGPVPHYPGEHKVELTPKRIVRDGEELQPDQCIGEAGPGIRIEGDRWFAERPGAGFLEATPDGRLQVAPLAYVTKDHLQGMLDFRHPQEGEPPLCREEVDVAVESLCIVHGHNQSRVDAAWRVFEARGVLMRSMRFASGTDPVQPQSARIDFEPRFQKQRARTDESGAVDHRDRGGVLNIEQGEVIGTWHQGEEPMPGMGVDGKVIEVPPAGPLRQLTLGSNIEIVEGEEGATVLRATVSGVLTVIRGKPSVSEVMTISGDVDYDTGNIDAGGSVLVSGSVRPGFSVTAKHSLTVMGVVEGADVTSGGDMDLRKGLIGAEGVRVIAGGDLSLRYAQNADITCRGNLEFHDADMGSTIAVSGDLSALRGRGRLRGGTYSAGGSISAREVGSDLGALTKLTCGVDVPAQREKAELAEELNGINMQLMKLKHKAEGGGPAAQQRIAKKKRALQKQQRPLLDRFAELEEPPKPEPGKDVIPPTIVGTERIYFGVEIGISRSSLRPGETTGARRFTLDPETRELRADPL